MDSLNRNYLKYALVFLLGLSVALNLVFYLRLSGPCGKSGDKCEKTENVQTISKEKATEATSTSQPMASPAALSTPSVPVADEAKASSSNAKQETPSLRYVSHSLDYSDCDGKKAKGTLRITIYGLRNQKEAVAVKVEPKPDKLDDVEFGYSLLSMKGVFEFGKTYTVRIPKGITVYDDKILKDDYLCMVDIVQPDPRIDFATEGPYYQTKAENGIITEWTMPVEHINEDSVQVILWGLEDRNIDVSENLIRKYWDSDDNAVTRLMQRLADVDVKLNGQKNVSIPNESEREQRLLKHKWKKNEREQMLRKLSLGDTRRKWGIFDR